MFESEGTLSAEAEKVEPGVYEYPSKLGLALVEQYGLDPKSTVSVEVGAFYPDYLVATVMVKRPHD